MVEQSDEGELDLSNLDSLLKDIEKDMPAEGAARTPSEPVETAEIPDVPPPVELSAIKQVTVAAPPAPEAKPTAEAEVVDDETDVDELLAPPVKNAKPDTADDLMEDMFTEDDELAAKPVTLGPSAVVDAKPVSEESGTEPEPVPEPETVVEAVVEAGAGPEDGKNFEDALELDVPATESAGAKAEDEDLSFVDALEIETPVAQKPDVVEPAAAQAPKPVPVLVGTPAMFVEALRGKNYSYALQIGEALRSRETSPAFRINLAGAMFHAGDAQDAEQELISVLESHPYLIHARRNLEFVRAAKP